ncbi:hypothetical protein CQ14_06705 [Bradyrhizobium lablabi]|uniref:Uncharacterized protein n=1 Tax=Bradyrhizobium lablabi TaxID=722472 RepID=A0A0R3MVP1_9BRAD|nr:hypothetical protein [Bradyrhizobium lablabi]KRR21334.1 hypothetical protein CQ14_06705 [Bradyrhizobium lablabi]
MTFTSIAFGLVSGFVGWMITEFLAKPFRKGIDLIAEAQSLTIVHANVQARCREVGTAGDGPIEQLHIPEEAEQRLQTAERSFREQGARLQAFAQTDRFAAQTLKLFSIDMLAAGVALVAMSNSIGIYGVNRNRARTNLEAKLRVGDYRKSP